MRVLVACERSNIVRDAFLKRGYDAWSCDLQRAEHPNINFRRHIQGNVRPLLKEQWDLVIAHPPCTHLSCSGARWFSNKKLLQQEGIAFFCEFVMCDVPRVCIENPIGIMSTIIGPPDQIVQPYQFGDRSRKATCLWLKGLPKLTPTNIVEPTLRMYDCGAIFSADYHKKIPGTKTMGTSRSVTYQGIADAMAEQWGGLT